jgi:hypothetical protein
MRNKKSKGERKDKEQRKKDTNKQTNKFTYCPVVQMWWCTKQSRCLIGTAESRHAAWKI